MTTSYAVKLGSTTVATYHSSRDGVIRVDRDGLSQRCDGGHNAHTLAKALGDDLARRHRDRRVTVVRDDGTVAMEWPVAARA